MYKFKKVLPLLSLVVFSSVSGIVAHHNSNTTLSLNECKKMQNGSGLGNYLHVDNDEVLGSNFTNIQLQDHKNALSDKLQLSLLAAGCDYDTIASTVGTFEANINDHYNSLQGLTTQNMDTYNFMESEANKFGVSVIDYDSMYNCVAKNISQSSPEAANTIQKLLVRDQYNLSDLAKFRTDLSLALGGTQNEVLSSMLQEIDLSFNNSLTVKDDGTFINKLSIYSSSGKYKEGDIISENDLQDVFQYQYQTTYGYDYASNFDQLEYIEPTSTGEYEQSVFDSLIAKKDMSGFDGAYASYAPGEFIPNYLLKAKILNLDYKTDSHKCDITFQFGVAPTNDPKNVVWSDINSQNENATKVTLNVKDFNNIKYCANNFYYNPSMTKQIDVTNLDKEVNSKGDIYLSNSIDKRNFIESVLAKYKGPQDQKDYDLVNHPIITTDPKDFEGLPQAVFKGISDIDNDYLHTNQKLALVISDMDDNVTVLDSYSLCLKMGWAIVDTDPVTNAVKPIYNIKFVDTDPLSNPDIPQDATISDSIWVRFDMNAEDKQTIRIATMISVFTSFIDSNRKLVNSKAYDNDAFNKKKALIDKARKLSIIAISLAGAATALAAIDLGLAVLYPPKRGEAALLMLMAVDSMVAAGLGLGLSYKAEDQLYALKNVKTIYDSINEQDDFYKTLKDINQHGDLVFDAHAMLDKKIAACKSVISIWDNNEAFRKQVGIFHANYKVFNYIQDNGKMPSQKTIDQWAVDASKKSDDKAFKRLDKATEALSYIGFAIFVVWAACCTEYLDTVNEAVTLVINNLVLGRDLPCQTILEDTMLRQWTVKSGLKYVDLRTSVMKVARPWAIAGIASILSLLLAVVADAITAASDSVIHDEQALNSK